MNRNVKTFASIVNSNKFKRVQIQRSVIQYVFKNIYDLKSLSTLERFLSLFHVIIAPTFEDYVNGVLPIRKTIIAFAINASDWIIIIRFGLLSYYDEPWIWILFGDSFYSWGWSRFVYAMFGTLGSAMATVKATFLVMAAKHELFVINYVQKIRENQSNPSLNREYYKMFCTKVKFCTKILYPALFVSAFVPILGHICSSMIVYIENEYDHSIFAMIISNVWIAIWISFGAAMGFGGAFVLQLIAIMHLKYEFRQINDAIKRCTAEHNYNSLMRAIVCHQKLSETVKKLNKFMNLLIGFCFFCCTPGMDILIFLVFKTDINLIFRLIYFIAGFGLITVQIAINYMCASFTATAHKSCNVLYKCLNDQNLSFKCRQRISLFIEKLSDKRIGFYCFDLFLCNNYEFYEYLSFFTRNYFLVHSFVNDFNISK